MNAEYCVVITTCSGEEQALKLADSIVEAGLAACVQLSDITSVYRWKGDICRDKELRLTIKTRRDCYKALESHIRSRHEYELPEIIMLPIEGGLEDYLGWITQNTLSAATTVQGA